MQLSTAFSLVADLAGLLGVSRINKLATHWECRIDEHWQIAVNGTDKPMLAQPEGSMGVTIEPYHMAVFFNGWLAGLLTPRDGTFVCGAAGNEDAFIAALEKRIAACGSNAEVSNDPTKGTKCSI